MPIKHQSDSYRNRKGERYVCWEDVLEGDIRAGARNTVLEMRSNHVRAFAEHNGDEGYSGIFIHEKDAIKQGILTPESKTKDVAEFFRLV